MMLKLQLPPVVLGCPGELQNTCVLPGGVPYILDWKSYKQSHVCLKFTSNLLKASI